MTPCPKGLTELKLKVRWAKNLLTVRGDYEAGEKGSWQHGQQQEPDSGGNFILYEVWLDELDITDILNSDTNKELEEAALTELGEI